MLSLSNAELSSRNSRPELSRPPWFFTAPDHIYSPVGTAWRIHGRQDPQELEAAAFRRLVQHLRERADVQNIDLMNLAGFCRNCLSKWYRAAAEERGVALSDPAAREIVYGMPYEEWKAKHQKEASPDQQKSFAAQHKH